MGLIRLIYWLRDNWWILLLSIVVVVVWSFVVFKAGGMLK